MKFYSVLKYVLMVVFAIIVGVGAAMNSTSDMKQPQPPVPQSGPKFNF